MVPATEDPAAEEPTAAERENVLPAEDDEKVATADQREAEEKRATDALAHHKHHVDHLLDEDGNPVIEHLYWTFAMILQPKPEVEMLEWLREGLSRAETVGDLERQSWKSLANEEKLTSDHKLTAADIDKLVERAAECGRFRGPFEDFVVEVAEKVDKTGLHMQLVQRTESSQHMVVMLLRCPEQVFNDEHKAHQLRRWKATGQGLKFYQDEANQKLGVVHEPTEADRIQLTAILLQKPEERGGCGFGNIEHLEDDEAHDPRIVSIFPMHNPEYVATILKEWKENVSCRKRFMKIIKAPFCRSPTKNCRSPPHKEAKAPAKHATRDVVDDADDVDKPNGANGTSFLQRSFSTVLSPQVASMQKLLKLDQAAEALLTQTEFLEKIQSQYGDRFAFLFAFMQAHSKALFGLYMAALFLHIVYLIVSMFAAQGAVAFNRRAVAMLGLLVPCVWCPVFLGRWDRHSQQLRQSWGVVGVTEVPLPSPFFTRRKEKHSCAQRFEKAGFVLVVVAAFCIAGFMNFVALEYEVITQITPLCNSFFAEKVWGKYIASDASEGGGFPLAWPSCFTGAATGPIDFWRGFNLFVQGILSGVFIDTCVQLMALLGEWLAQNANDPTWQGYEKRLANLTYPLELGGFHFYFWFLAFVFIPFGEEIQLNLLAEGKENKIDIYDNHNPLFHSPCKLYNNSVCDEWRGSCAHFTDHDCSKIGCTDELAWNYDNNSDPDKSIDRLQYPISSLEGISLPQRALCLYETTIDGVSEYTTCPTVDDGHCDEPLYCLLRAMKQHRKIAGTLFGDCEEANMAHSCPIGSDTLDCRGLIADILEFGKGQVRDGLLVILEARFAHGPDNATTPEEACKLIKPLDPNGTLCASFGNTWSVGRRPDRWTDEIDPIVEENEVAIRCKTPSAVQCLEYCDPCVGCLTSSRTGDPVVDRSTDGGNMTFCEEYDLCQSCMKACGRFTDCFPDVSKERAAVGNSCERIGWVENGYCDALHEDDKLECTDDRMANESWACDYDDDVTDCSAKCNFGCDDEDDVNYKDAVYAYPDACAEKTWHSVRHMMEIWLHDKRFLNQIDVAIAVPITIALFLGYVMEVLMVYFCFTWRKSSRRKSGYKGKSFRCGRCLCCLCHKCKCCECMMNCFMCDSVAQSDQGTCALEIGDEELAEKISENVSHPVKVRTKEWNSKHIGQFAAADDIILESMLDPIDLRNEFNQQCIILSVVCMYTIVWPHIAVVMLAIVEIRHHFDFVRLTKHARRPVPVKPQDDDATGGFRPWLQSQMFLSCIVTSLCVVLSTGQLESFVMLVDENGCHPPKDHQTTFKYPECMDTLSIETNVALYGFDEESTDDMYEPEDAIDETYVLMAMNRSCFQTVPTLGDGCVFEIADEDFDGSTLLGTKQVLIRFVCFMVIEHVQFTVIMLMSRRNDDKSTSTKRSGEVHRLHQHHLVAEHLFPSKTEDKVYFRMQTKRAAKKIGKKLLESRSRA